MSHAEDFNSQVLTEQTVHSALSNLKHRPLDSHKGDFGTVVVVGGCPDMIGAPTLTATAAFRAGAGLVKMALPASIAPFGLTLQPSATAISLTDDLATVGDDLAKIDASCKPGTGTVLAIGPGWGAADDYKKRLLSGLLIPKRPAVIDADGLNLLAEMKVPLTALAGHDRWLPIVLTPHPGEMSRLLAAADLPEMGQGTQERLLAAQRLSRFHGATVLLKGHQTVIVNHSGHYQNETGHPVMATAGSGDVLTGVIAALLAGNLESHQDEAGFLSRCAMGAYWHGLAGAYWAQNKTQTAQKPGNPLSLGMLAADLAETLPQVIANLV